MHLKLLTMVVALVGCTASPGLTQEKPLWTSTIGDLIGLPAATSTPVETATEPGSVNIEFVVDQCDASAVAPITLAELQPEPEPVPLPQAAPLPLAAPLTEIASLPEAVPDPEPQPKPLVVSETAPENVVPNPMDIAVVPDAVLPSLESFVTPVPVAQRGPVQVSPSIIYLP